MYLGLGKLNRHLVSKLSNLRYIILSLYNESTSEINKAQSEVMTYAMSAMASTEYIERLPTYSKNIL